MQPVVNSFTEPSDDGDEPARSTAAGHSRWSLPVSASVEWVLTGELLTVALAGEVCSWSVRRIEPVVRAVIESLDPHAVTIDLSAVSFLDARGVSMYVGLAASADEHQRSFEIAGASEASRRVLALCGLDANGVLQATG
jgi:anti-anti-sigma factor